MKRKTCFIVTAIVCAATAVSCEREKEHIIGHMTDSGYYRTALEKLDWGNDTVFVVGHKAPDADAVCSSISYAALMNSIGYRCQARMAGSANRATVYASDRMGFTLPAVMENANGCRLILMDHSDYAQAIDGADGAQIIQIIDHQAMGDVRSSLPMYCRVMPLGATCTMVYQSYRELGQAIPDSIAKVLLTGIIDDTNYLKKITSTANDSTALVAMLAQLGMSKADADSLYRGIERASRNFYGMTDTGIFNSDMKDYNICGYKLRIASLDWYMNEMEDLNNRMLAVMPTIMSDNHLDMIFAKIDRHDPNPNFGVEGASTCNEEHIGSGSWILYYGKLSQQVAESAYGHSQSTGVICHDTKLSRKTDMVPALTLAIQSLHLTLAL